MKNILEYEQTGSCSWFNPPAETDIKSCKGFLGETYTSKKIRNKCNSILWMRHQRAFLQTGACRSSSCAVNCIYQGWTPGKAWAENTVFILLLWGCNRVNVLFVFSIRLQHNKMGAKGTEWTKMPPVGAGRIHSYREPLVWGCLLPNEVGQLLQSNELLNVFRQHCQRLTDDGVPCTKHTKDHNCSHAICSGAMCLSLLGTSVKIGSNFMSN